MDFKVGDKVRLHGAEVEILEVFGSTITVLTEIGIVEQVDWDDLLSQNVGYDRSVKYETEIAVKAIDILISWLDTQVLTVELANEIWGKESAETLLERYAECMAADTSGALFWYRLNSYQKVTFMEYLFDRGHKQC